MFACVAPVGIAIAGTTRAPQLSSEVAANPFSRSLPPLAGNEASAQEDGTVAIMNFRDEMRENLIQMFFDEAAHPRQHIFHVFRLHICKLPMIGRVA